MDSRHSEQLPKGQLLIQPDFGAAEGVPDRISTGKRASVLRLAARPDRVDYSREVAVMEIGGG